MVIGQFCIGGIEHVYKSFNGFDTGILDVYRMKVDDAIISFQYLTDFSAP